MKTLTKYWFLEGFNLFKKLGKPTMMKMCAMLEMQHINKGSNITAGEQNQKCIFFLKKGAVKIVDSENNNTKYIVKAGNIFGELSIYDKQAAAEETAITLEDSILCYIESEVMENLIEEHKSLKNGLLKIYGLRIKKLERRLQDLLYKESKVRISEFIYSYIKEFGTEKEGFLIAKKLLSHKDIANLTNTSRQTVNNILSSMRKHKELDYNSKYISIPKKMK